MPLPEHDVLTYLQHLEPGWSIGRVQNLTTGLETHVYAYTRQKGAREEHRVLRIHGGDTDLPKARNEFRVMRHLHGTGYPVPAVYQLEESAAPLGGGPCLIMDRAPGRPLAADLAEAPEPIKKDLVGQCCALLVRLHHLDWRSFIGPVWPDAQAARSALEPEAIAAAIREAGLEPWLAPLAAWLTAGGPGGPGSHARLALQHGDFHGGNILRDEQGNLTVIDWSYAGLGDPRGDLANTLLLLRLMGQPGLAAAMREEYERLAGPLADFAWFEGLAAARRLVQATALLLAGPDAPAGELKLRPEQAAYREPWLAFLRRPLALLAEAGAPPLPAFDQALDKL